MQVLSFSGPLESCAIENVLQFHSYTGSPEILHFISRSHTQPHNVCDIDNIFYENKRTCQMNKEIAFMMKLLEVMHLLQEKKKDTNTLLTCGSCCAKC